MSGQTMCKRRNLNLYLTPYKKLTQNGGNTECVRDILDKTVKLLEEKIEISLCDFWFGSGFLDTTPKA